ncbi:MAG: hypothetical protein OXG47_03550 [bacterium]|nr:hypothetical protein [bacterium]
MRHTTRRDGRTLVILPLCERGWWGYRITLDGVEIASAPPEYPTETAAAAAGYKAAAAIPLPGLDGRLDL